MPPVEKPRAATPSLATAKSIVTIIIIKPEPIDNGSSPAEPTEQKYLLHKEFLYHYSPYFSTMFNGRFQESETLKMVFEDVNPRHFGLLAQWIYDRNLKDSPKAKTLGPLGLAKLWLLADRFSMLEMQNDVMNQLHLILRTKGLTDDFCKFAAFVYSLKPSRKVLQRIATTVMCASSHQLDTTTTAKLPPGLMTDAMNILKDHLAGLPYHHRFLWDNYPQDDFWVDS